MIAKWLAVALVVACGGLIANQIWYERRRRMQTAEMSSELGKWEAEGGNVPQVRGNFPEPGKTLRSP